MTLAGKDSSMIWDSAQYLVLIALVRGKGSDKSAQSMGIDKGSDKSLDL